MIENLEPTSQADKRISFKKKKLIQPLQLAWQQWYDSLPANAQALLDIAKAEPSAPRPRTRTNADQRSEHDTSIPLRSDVAPYASIQGSARDAPFRPPHHQYQNIAIFATSTLHRGLLATIHAAHHAAVFTHDIRARLWEGVAIALGVTHIGATAPIPLNIDDDRRLNDVRANDTSKEVGGIEQVQKSDLVVNGHRDQLAKHALTAQSTVDNTAQLDNGTNVLRSPTAFQPLYGNFGPMDAHAQPFSEDLASRIFWARANQFGVVQVWSPLHTMFSAGNVREKERVLKKFPDYSPVPTSSLGDDLTSVDEYSGPVTAVDLYAGIGYFALCYRRSGLAQVVLCWELNPWSIEGFCRGVAANKFPSFPRSSPFAPSQCHGLHRYKRQQRDQQVQIVAEKEHFDGCGEIWNSWPSDTSTQTCNSKPDTNSKDAGSSPPASACLHTKHGFVVFAESNEHAWTRRIRDIRYSVPPIRHVNCGLLPTSAPSWETAVRALDNRLGGWVHAHENVAVQDIEARAKQLVVRFQELAAIVYEVEKDEVSLKDDGNVEKLSLARDDREPHRWHVDCVQVFRVKTYAPGVMHCVFDIKMTPLNTWQNNL